MSCVHGGLPLCVFTHALSRPVQCKCHVGHGFSAACVARSPNTDCSSCAKVEGVSVPFYVKA